MPPKFSLQPVLDYRHNRVEALEIELGQLFARQKEVENQLEMIFFSEAQLWEALNKAQVGDLDIVLLEQLRSQLQNVEQLKEDTKVKLHEIQQRVEDKRQELVCAKQDEEVLVILKDKEVQRFMERQNRSELSMQDDIYISQAYQARIA